MSLSDFKQYLSLGEKITGTSDYMLEDWTEQSWYYNKEDDRLYYWNRDCVDACVEFGMYYLNGVRNVVVGTDMTSIMMGFPYGTRFLVFLNERRMDESEVRETDLKTCATPKFVVLPGTTSKVECSAALPEVVTESTTESKVEVEGSVTKKQKKV